MVPTVYPVPMPAHQPPSPCSFTHVIEDAANGGCTAAGDKLTERTFTSLDTELKTSQSALTSQV